jgi:hypothetical protein
LTCIIGAGLAYEGLRLLITAGPANLPRLNEISLDGHALAFTLAISVLSGLLFGSIPAFKYAGGCIAPGVTRAQQAILDKVAAIPGVRAAGFPGSLPLEGIEPNWDSITATIARTSFTLFMLAIAGAMALLLGLVGIYGVIAYAVSQRRREIGIRLALGAESGDVKRMFVRHGLALAGIGMAIGLPAAALMKSLLFGISPLDPLAFATAPAVLVFAAALASFLPASAGGHGGPCRGAQGRMNRAFSFQQSAFSF